MDSHGENVHSHPLAPMLYGFSCHLCLPSGLAAVADGEALGLGTMGISIVSRCSFWPPAPAPACTTTCTALQARMAELRVLRPGGVSLFLMQAKMHEMLGEAGFKSTKVLDWAHPLNRYYEARP